MPPAGSTYSTTRTVNERSSSRIVVTEDIRYGSGGNPPRLGGVRITFQARVPDGVRAFDFDLVTNTATAQTLFQLVDISYGGVVMGHVSIICEAAPGGDGVLPVSVQAWWDNPRGAPAEFDVELLP